MSAASRRQLRELLNEAPTTAQFLQDVLAAVEGLYADDDCPDGFRLLEEAIEAFEEDGEPDDDEGDEEGYDNEEDDEE
jgi:hypothetical protein